MDGWRLQKEAGKGPVRALLLRTSLVSPMKPPIADGMLPVRELVLRLRRVSPVKTPKEDGMLPER